jgi:hypothetical protein
MGPDVIPDRTMAVRRKRIARGRYLNGLLVVTGFMLLIPTPSSVIAQGSSCSYDAGSHAVTGHPNATDLADTFYDFKVLDGRILFDGHPCGEATVTNTDIIQFSGLSEDVAIYSEFVDVQLPFTPGFTAEADGFPEIEIALDFPTGTGTVDIYGTAGADSLVVGTSGYNTNRDTDVDITVTGGDGGDLEGRAGADFISATGGSGTGGASLDLAFRLNGEKGNDRVVDGPRSSDVISGGPGKDILRGGGGNDNLDPFAPEGRDKLFGGLGRDRCYGKPEKDKTRSCERKFLPLY